jgi:hypothetical protein
MSTPETEKESRIDDAALSRMLEVYAGPPTPVTVRHRRHRATPRTALVITAVALALGGLVPASLAVVRSLTETPAQFVRDNTQPANARRAIQSYLNGRPQSAPKLASIRGVVDASTPGGHFRLYELAAPSGAQGLALIDSSTGGVAVLSWRGASGCPASSALEAGPSFVEHPGETPLYLTGRVSPSVAAIDVVGSDGSISRGAVSEGFFLAWLNPSPQASASAQNIVASIVARNSNGAEIGHLRVRADGDIPPAPGQPPQAIGCG